MDGLLIHGTTEEQLLNKWSTLMDKKIETIIKLQNEPTLSIKEMCAKLKICDKTFRDMRLKYDFENYGTPSRPRYKSSDIESKMKSK